MKLFALASIALAASAVSSFAQISPVRMDVLQRQKTDSNGKSNESKKQVRSLDISLQNLSKQDANVVVKYWFFARKVSGGDTTVFRSGERKAAVAPGKTEHVESEMVSSSFTEDHFKVERSKSRGNSGNTNTKVSKVEGRGERIVGYGVRLMDGTKVLSEVFSPQGLKKLVK